MRLLWFSILAVVVSTAMFGAAVYTALQTQERFASTTAAVCSFRDDLQRRYDYGVDYLAAHPDGVPQLDLSAADLIRSLKAQKATLDSLSELDCN